MNCLFPQKFLVLPALAAVLLVAANAGTERVLFVSPSGDDQADGSEQAPLRTPGRAQEAARALLKGMNGDVVVNFAPGDYRLDHPWRFTEADSGRNGFHVMYRSSGGPDKARLLGSVALKGWQPVRGGIWKVELPPNRSFHTLYENGMRAQLARFPNLERDPQMPVALGRYLVTLDGTPKQTDKGEPRQRGPGWLTFGAADLPPVTEVTKMRLHIFPGGKCDWVREIHAVTSFDPQSRRLEFDRDPVHGVGVGARFFLEDELGFLDAPGEFFVEEKTRTLYYYPLGKGHPDALGIAAPVLNRLVQFEGKSRSQCVERIVLDGLGLAETDNSPPQALWAYDGLRDGAMVWMRNTAQIEIRNCHLKNSGRSGVIMIGHNVGNCVSGSWIEHMGLNGVSLCNRFSSPDGKEPTADRCENNRIHNTRISHVGELHTYAECVTMFNVSNNELDHCELSHSVRYAITLRGNTGVQYGPPVTTPHPPARGNRCHHLQISHCGQDGGDMGALHAAALNNPGGGSVNTFEQITVADTAAIPSVQDIAPDGIFLDWPKMAMDQVFRHVEIIRSQGGPFRSHGLDNGESARTENVSWKPGFREDLMDYANIGLTDGFPAAFGGRPVRVLRLPPPARVSGRALAHDTVALAWEAGPGAVGLMYRVRRNGQEVACVAEPRWTDRGLRERTTYRYEVAVRVGDFTHFSQPAAFELTTPADGEAPGVRRACASRDGRGVRVVFTEPVDDRLALAPSSYRFSPACRIGSIRKAGGAGVQMALEGLAPGLPSQLFVQGITDLAVSRNSMGGENPIPVTAAPWTVRYSVAADDAAAGLLEDLSGGDNSARLQGGAIIEADSRAVGGAAMVLDGVAAFAEASPSLNLGPGDFTFAVWAYCENSGVILSKGTDFGQPEQWSFGSPKEGVPGSVSLRIKNQYFATGDRSVKQRRWTHLAFARSGKRGVSYVDGVPSGGPHDMSGVSPLVNDRPLRLGRREYEANPVYFKGRIAGLTIWPRALTGDEIRQEAAKKEEP